MFISLLKFQLKLTNTGFEYNGIIFKVKIVSLVADTVAKNSLLGMMGW